MYKQYLFKKLLINFLAITLMLCLIINVYLLQRILEDIMQEQYLYSVMFPFVTYLIFESLPMILPLSMVLSVILVLSKQYQEGEIYAAFSCGIGYENIIMTVFRVVIPLALLLLVFVMEISPLIKMQIEHLQVSSKKNISTDWITPGKFISFDDNLVVFAEKYDRSRKYLENIFIAHDDGGQLAIETVASGEQKTTAEGEKSLYLYNGKRFQGTVGETYFRSVTFDEHKLHLPPINTAVNINDPELLNWYVLMHSSNPVHIAELQNRLSIPISLIILALLAIPLSQSPPRKGPYVRIMGAIIICYLYLSLIHFINKLVATGFISPVPSVWGIHFIMLLLSIILIYKRNLYLRLVGKSL